MQRKLIGFSLSLVLLLGLSPTLLQAAALTEQQIQAIMNLVRSFSADEAVVRSVQLSLEGKTPVIAPQVHIQTPPKIGCIMLTTNLRYRMEEWTTGGQISLLQDFLKTRGLFKQKSNGFFGVTTLQAVNKFQESVGLSSTGFVGPLTRGKIKEQTCGGVVVIPMRPPIGKIAVLSPNGGETWQKGTTQTIKWNSNLVSIPEQPIIYYNSLLPSFSSPPLPPAPSPLSPPFFFLVFKNEFSYPIFFRRGVGGGGWGGEDWSGVPPRRRRAANRTADIPGIG